MSTQFLSVHCHYYQPPRGNPFDPTPLVEADAAPFNNWNERITHECYTPNAEVGNFDAISFNVGETLAGWLAAHAPETYARIVAADRTNVEQWGNGNAIAQPLHHTILPLSRKEDKVTQIKWGQAAFRHRFGRESEGMWIPEMAIDHETIEALIDSGIKWTILSEGQVDGKPAGSGPFWARLANGKKIKVFIRDERLSNDIAFNLGRFGGAGRWAHEALVPRKREAGALTLIASDGETFGHHWPGEEQFLHWLLGYEAHAAGYDVITLNRYARQTEPSAEVGLRENTAWSCGHGLGRWATGCGCTPGQSHWKGAVRRAMDNLRHEIDGVYEAETRRMAGKSGIQLRDAYIDVALGLAPGADFLRRQEIDLPEAESRRLLALVEAQYYRQCMYASCTWFFPDLDSHTTRYGIASAAYAIKRVREATGIDLSGEFRRDLSIATGSEIKTGLPIDGALIYDDLVEAMAGQA